MQVCSLLLFSSSHSTWKSKKVRHLGSKETQTHASNMPHCFQMALAEPRSVFSRPVLLWDSPSLYPLKERSKQQRWKWSQRQKKGWVWLFSAYLKGECSECDALKKKKNPQGFNRTGGNGNVSRFYFFLKEPYKYYLIALPHELKYKQQSLAQ